MAIRASDGAKNVLILPTGQWYAPSAVIYDSLYCMVLHGCRVSHYIAWYCMVLHGIAWYCMVLLGIALSCIVLHYNALYCNILHYLEQSFTILHSLARVYIGYTCSQQMSPVIAFDIAVVAQKVQVSVI